MESKQVTVLKALEIIHHQSQKSKLKIEQYDSILNEIKMVSDYFQINKIQSIILASFICLSCLDEVELSDVIKYFELENIEFLPYLCEIEFLERKNILNKNVHRRFKTTDYSIKPHLINFLIENKAIPNELITIKESENDFYGFLKEIDALSDQKDNEDIEYPFFLYQFDKLLKDNNHFKLVDFVSKNLEPIDAFVFFDVIIDGIAICENNFQSSLQSTVDDFTNVKRETFKYISDFLEGKTKLNRLNLVEKDNSSFSDKHKIQLTQKSLSMLFKMEGVKIDHAINKNEKLIYPDKIKKVNLFYNDFEQQQLEPISKSLSAKDFSILQKRLLKNNMPTGITALLYGASGTGKTETVYQLAKKYKRPIFKVEISETKSMWFGESQKLVKKIFTDYYMYKKSEKVCPILLFNEADAVIGKRKNAGSSSVAETENAIQNILLEELEKFDGILFATSNLAQNLDEAFERRFLFKIKFDKPSIENSAKIWENKLPCLTIKEARHLAEKFPFSGGEMENIARKALMEEVLTGKISDFKSILSFCENEKWNYKSANQKIGY